MFNIIYEKQQEKKGLKFPLIAKSACDGKTVLFFTGDNGVVIEMPNQLDAFLIGGCSSTWMHPTDSEIWQILHEDVQINLVVKEQA